MATYKICKNCKQFVEIIKESNSDFGYDTIHYKCPECGYVETQQINRIHYGNDEYK